MHGEKKEEAGSERQNERHGKRIQDELPTSPADGGVDFVQRHPDVENTQDGAVVWVKVALRAGAGGIVVDGIDQPYDAVPLPPSVNAGTAAD
jgi:hypothetical protein